MPDTTTRADRAARITHRPGRMGLVMYARILGACVDSPRTPTDVAAQLGRGAQSVHEILWRLEAMGAAHVAGWVPAAGGRGMLQPTFAAFPGASAPYPRPLKRGPIGRQAGGTRSEVISFAAVLKAMREGATRSEVLALTGIGWSNFAKLLRELRRQRLVHVCAWEPRADERMGGVEVFRFGPGRDAPRPKPEPRSETYRRYRQRRIAREAGQRVVQALAGQAAAMGGALA